MSDKFYRCAAVLAATCFPDLSRSLLSAILAHSDHCQLPRTIVALVGKPAKPEAFEVHHSSQCTNIFTYMPEQVDSAFFL